MFGHSGASLFECARVVGILLLRARRDGSSDVFYRYSISYSDPTAPLRHLGRWSEMNGKLSMIPTDLTDAAVDALA